MHSRRRAAAVEAGVIDVLLLVLDTHSSADSVAGPACVALKHVLNGATTQAKQQAKRDWVEARAAAQYAPTSLLVGEFFHAQPPSRRRQPAHRPVEPHDPPAGAHAILSHPVEQQWHASASQQSSAGLLRQRSSLHMLPF